VALKCCHSLFFGLPRPRLPEFGVRGVVEGVVDPRSRLPEYDVVVDRFLEDTRSGDIYTDAALLRSLLLLDDESLESLSLYIILLPS